MSKFNVGDKVVLFNSLSCEFEKDEVFCVLFVPVPVPGRGEPKSNSIAEQLANGEVEIKEQYQTLQHKIVDADILFANEDDARDYYLSVLKK